LKLLKNISKIYDDESIEGYAHRLAWINYVPIGYLELGKLSKISSPEEVLIYINKIREITEEEVNEVNLLHTWYVEYFGLPGWCVYNYSRFCSFCLFEKSYHRLQWGLSCITICSKHKVYLLERCQNCNKRTTIQEMISSVCNKCKNKLSESCRTISLETNYLNLDEYYNKSRYNSVLTYKEFIKLYKEVTIFILIRILKIPISEKEKKNFIYWGYLENIPQISYYNLIAFEMMEEWPTNAITLLMQKFGVSPRKLVEELMYFISKVDSIPLRKQLRHSLYRSESLDRALGHIE
jgi:hypothetical protein